MNLKTVIVAGLIAAPSSMFAQSMECQLTAYGALAGFSSPKAGQTWVPSKMSVSLEGDQMQFTYFDEVATDNKISKKDGKLEARDEIGVSNSQASLLMKFKLILDPNTNEAKMSAVSSASGYRNLRISGYYKCQ